MVQKLTFLLCYNETMVSKAEKAKKYSKALRLYAMWEIVSPLVDKDKDWIYNAPKEEADAIIKYSQEEVSFLMEYNSTYEQTMQSFMKPSEKEILPYYQKLMQDPYWRGIYEKYTAKV